MKKFLIVLVSIIVFLCLGMTFYYFSKDEEVISIKTTKIYLNIGESISLDELGFSHTDKKHETKINFNAGGDAVTSIIKYNEKSKEYETTNVGGSTTIVITTNNKRFKRFEISVEIGNGTEDAPYQIYNETDLFNIGTKNFDFNGLSPMEANYILMNNITITEDHQPIGKLENGYYETFNGTLNGNQYTIKDLYITSNTYGGLFAILGEKSKVTDLHFNNPTLTGNFGYVGTLAGISNGKIDRVCVVDPQIINTNTSTSYTGGVVGVLETRDVVVEDGGNSASIVRTTVETDKSYYGIKGYHYLGGIAGRINCAKAEALISNIKIEQQSTTESYCGGIAGELISDYGYGHIRQSYSLSRLILKNSSVGHNGALIGYINVGDGSTVEKKTVVLGLYYNSTLCAESAFGGMSALLDTNTLFGKTTRELKDDYYDRYIYYYNKDNVAMYWDSAIWKFAKGQYPVLKYTDTSLPNNIDNGNNSSDINPIEPSDPMSPQEPITDPDEDIHDKDITSNVVQISSVSDLENTTFEVNHTYILTKNLDFEGKTWTPKPLPYNCSFISENDNEYAISNLKIKTVNGLAGFFSTINSSNVQNIKFVNVTIDITDATKYAGILAGQINNSSITNVDLRNCEIKTNNVNATSLSYVGGLVGTSTNNTSTIKECDVSVNIEKDISNVGGIVGWLGDNNLIQNSTYNGTIYGKYTVGGIVAQNHGTIKNVSAVVTIYSESQNNKISYFGGIAGTNFATITSSTINLKMDVINENNSNYSYNVGGITGYNTTGSVVSNCKVSNISSLESYNADISITNNSSARIYLGGISGQNKGSIYKCYNALKQIGTSLNSVFAGGISATNHQNGSITRSKATSSIYGQYVGGLVYNVSDNALMSECMVGSGNVSEDKDNRTYLKGLEVAGIVHTMTKGTIINCVSVVSSFSLENGINAGVVVDFPGNTSNYGIIAFCVVSNAFAGNGTKYLETPSDIFSKKMVSGVLTNCVLDNTYADGVNVASYDKAFLIFGNAKPESGSNYISATKAQMLNYDTYSKFDVSENSITSWYYDHSKGIQLRAMNESIFK